MALGELLEIMYSNGSSYFLTGQVILKPMKSILNNKKQLHQKCDQEPIFKIYWSCLPLSKHYADKQDDAVCEV